MGYFIVFKAMQYEIKTEIFDQINEGFDPKKLVCITINKSDISNIEWFDEGNEMLYNNKLYDIVRSTQNKTSTTYYCINDNKETVLIANLGNHINSSVQSNKSAKNQTANKIFDKEIKLFFLTEKSFPNNLQSTSKISFINVIYQRPQIKLNYPPPKFV